MANPFSLWSESVESFGHQSSGKGHLPDVLRAAALTLSGRPMTIVEVGVRLRYTTSELQGVLGPGQSVQVYDDVNSQTIDTHWPSANASSCVAKASAGSIHCPLDMTTVAKDFLFYFSGRML